MPSLSSSTRRGLLPRAALLSGLCAAAPMAAADALSGNLSLTSDYVWRGTTQTQGDFAAQAGLKWAAQNGLYGSAWGSNVEFAPSTHASSELDLVLGWAGALNAHWSLDANLTHYRYPSTTADLDWTELGATLAWNQSYWLQLGWSNDVMASGAQGTYAQVGARLPLGTRLRAEAALGHYWLDQAYGANYTHGQLGLVWAIKAPLELRMTVHETDHAAERLFPGLAGSRVEAALQMSF